MPSRRQLRPRQIIKGSFISLFKMAVLLKKLFSLIITQLIVPTGDVQSPQR